MDKNKKSRTANRVAQGIATASFLMLIWTIVLMLVNWTIIADFIKSEFGYVFIIFTINAVFSAVLGLLIISRNPGHRLGWLFIAIGFLFSWWELSGALLEITGLEGIPPFLRPIVVIGGLAYLLPLIMTMTLVPLYFPTGRLLSRRWRPVLLITLVGIIGQALAQGLLDLFDEIPELEKTGMEPILMRANELMGFILIIAIICSILSLIIRFVRSRGDERTQMKWLVYTAVMSISLMLLMSFTLGEDSLLLGIFSSAIPIYLTIAIGIAILRHQLFDIDLIIRRTLQYSLLTAMLALVYFGSVVILQSLAENLTGEQSPLVIVLSTLAIAALFNPLRTRVQDFIDRRFYRKKYDAEKALAQFAITARDEVELDQLTSALLGIVEETMQPEQVFLWLQLPSDQIKNGRNHV
jgi:hypothetical protein